MRARLLGRIWSGGHYCSGDPEFRKRVKRAGQRQVRREADEALSERLASTGAAA